MQHGPALHDLPFEFAKQFPATKTLFLRFNVQASGAASFSRLALVAPSRLLGCTLPSVRDHPHFPAPFFPHG